MASSGFIPFTLFFSLFLPFSSDEEAIGFCFSGRFVSGSSIFPRIFGPVSRSTLSFINSTSFSIGFVGGKGGGVSICTSFCFASFLTTVSSFPFTTFLGFSFTVVSIFSFF